MYRRSAIAICLVIASLFVASVTAGRQKPESLVGRWDLVVQGTDAPYTSWLEVEKDKDGQLTGNFVGRFGSVRPIKHLEFSNGNLNFSLPPQYEKRKDDLVFSGKLTGDRLGGTTVGEDGKTLQWTGKRAPALKPSANPQWGTPIQLFNGKDLTGWKLRSEKAQGCWSVDDGALTNGKGCVDIISQEKFKDYKLSLEFKLADPQTNGGQPSNSGVYQRGRYEVQVLDDYGKPVESHGMGSVYGFLTPKENSTKPAGEWQKYEITLIGRQITVVLNGKTLIDKAEIPGITGGALDSDEGSPGPIMLQGDHGKVWFRNIVITPVAKG